VAALYVHHFADHSKELTLGYKLLMQTGPGQWRLRWISPEDGTEIASETVSAHQQFIEFVVPPVTIDLACRLDRLGPPVEGDTGAASSLKVNRM
jgi:hypothetical protein